MENTPEVKELPLVRDVDATVAVKTRNPLNFRKWLIICLVSFVLAVISAAVGTYLYVDIGEHKDPNIAPIFLVWLVISYAIAYVVGLMAFFAYRHTMKKAAKSDVEEGQPLQDLRRISRPISAYIAPSCSLRTDTLTGSDHRRSGSNGSPFPVTYFQARGRMTGQDSQQKRMSRVEAAAVHDDMAITPVKRSTIVPKSPFDSHPNPLASSPIMASPPPNFPSAAFLRAQASNHSGYSDHSHATQCTTSTKPARDPFNNQASDIKSASSVSLTSYHAHEVSIARMDSLKKIREATKRRAEAI